MNTVPQIRPGAIQGIKFKKDRPVFFLTMSGDVGPSIVVKGENIIRNGTVHDTEVTLKWSSKLMKNVNDDQVNTKIMAPDEITAFRDAARVLITNQEKLTEVNVANYKWVKMPFVIDLSDADTWELEGTEKLKAVKELIGKMSNASAWMELGKVIAVDIFNGNNDRFTDDGAWQNKGNVMFQQKQNGQLKVMGLDTFDPNSGRGNANQAMSREDEEALQILKTDLAQTQYGEKVTTAVTKFIVAELNKVSYGKAYLTIKAGDKNVKIDLLDKTLNIFSGYVEDLTKGIKAGTLDLKTYLQGKHRQYYNPFTSAAPTTARGNFNMGANRAGARNANPNPNPNPGQGFVGVHGAPVVGKTIPQRILDKMRFMGWIQ